MFCPESQLTIDHKWLELMGFQPVESDMGPNYEDHWQCGLLNIWEFNDTGVWLFNDADWIQLKTRDDVRMLMALAGIHTFFTI